MAVKINNIEYSGFFYNGEALTAMYLNGNKVYGSESQPQEYSITLTPVEWVSNENISTRIWLDLGYVWKNNSRAQLGFVIPGSHQKPNGQQVFGEDTVWASDGNGPVDDNNDLRLFFTKSGSNIGAYWDVATSRKQATIGAITDIWQYWEIGNNYIKNLSNNTNFVTGSTYNISRTGNVGLYGACQYLNTGRTDCVRYSYVKIYEGDTLVKDVIPVLDNNNIPCFFDKISEELIYYKVNGEPSTGLTAGNAIQKLDYLQGDGSDYVVLDYIPSATTVAEIVVEGGDNTNRYLFGGRNRSSNGTLLSSVAINNYTSLKFYFLRGSKSYQVSNTTSKQTIKSTPDGGYINGTKVATYTEQTDTINAPFGLYHAMQYVNGKITIDTGLPQRGFNGKIYSFKVWENNTLVRNYVPAVINGKTGFYDTVLNNFYPSVYNTLTSGSVVGDVSIKIVYSESSVTISNSSVSGITVGNTFNLNASVVPTGSTLTYTSSNPSVASVDSNGIVSGIASGSTTITIIASEYVDDENRIVYRSGTSTVNLSIIDNWVTTAQTISYTALPQSDMTEGETHNLNASTTPTGGTLSYSSSNSSVATVDSNGIVTAVAEGNATITISVGAWDDNANHIHYTASSKTVSVVVNGAEVVTYDYIQGDGSDYIMTDYAPDTYTEVEVMYMSQSDNNMCLFGCDDGSRTPFRISERSTGTKLFFEKAGQYVEANIPSDILLSEEPWTAKITPSGAYISGISCGNFDKGGFISDNSLAILGCHVGPDMYSESVIRQTTAKIYYVKIWKHGVLLHNYLPVMKGNKVGMLDAVTSTFIASATQGATVANDGPLMPPIYFDASNAGNVNIQTITDDGLSGETKISTASKTVYFNVDSRATAMDNMHSYRIRTSDKFAQFYDPDGGLIDLANQAPSGQEMWIPMDCKKIGTYKLEMPGIGGFFPAKATFQIIPPSN